MKVYWVWVHTLSLSKVRKRLGTRVGDRGATGMTGLVRRAAQVMHKPGYLK